MLKTILVCLFTLAVAHGHAQNANDTFRLYFELDEAKLSDSIQRQIDLLIYDDYILQKSKVLIIGYADYLGSSQYNKALSLQRSRNVKQYLVTYGIGAENIKLCIGKGEVERKNGGSTEGFPIDRRVDLVVAPNTSKKINNRAHPIIKVAGHKRVPLMSPAQPPVEPAPANVQGGLAGIAKYKPGQTIVLKNIYFERQRHTVKKESNPQLEELYNTLKNRPSLKISIEGHVCCIHDYPDALDMDNMEQHLSVNRAKEIYKYLVRKGIDEDRLTYVGFGRSRPIVKNERSEEEADINRRVEIRVLEN